MATYLFDSNAVSDAMADHPQLRARCAAQAGLLQTSAIVVGEIRYGLARLPAGKRRDALTAKADLVLAALLIEPSRKLPPWFTPIFAQRLSPAASIWTTTICGSPQPH